MPVPDQERARWRRRRCSDARKRPRQEARERSGEASAAEARALRARRAPRGTAMSRPRSKIDLPTTAVGGSSPMSATETIWRRRKRKNHSLSARSGRPKRGPSTATVASAAEDAPMRDASSKATRDDGVADGRCVGGIEAGRSQSHAGSLVIARTERYSRAGWRAGRPPRGAAILRARGRRPGRPRAAARSVALSSAKGLTPRP